MEMVDMHPCEQKEEIKAIKDKLDTRDVVLSDLKVKQAEIAGDVSHIKTRIDNGMSHTIKDIHERLVAIAPVIEHHASIVKRIEDFGWLISRWVTTGLVMILLGIVVWAISKGFKP
jgi:hypothetical protein